MINRQGMMFSDLSAIKIKKDPPNTEGKNGGCGKNTHYFCKLLSKNNYLFFHFSSLYHLTVSVLYTSTTLMSSDF